mgnify:CR=1 FL=1
MEKAGAVLRRIHEVRKIKQRNIHDCAAFLNLSKEDYLRFEQGTKWLSLPEIELLALFLGVSPAIFFQPDHWEREKLNLLDDHIQPQFTMLRDKMIQAKISLKLREQPLTFEEISEKTGIPLNELNPYLNGEMSIPLDQLLKICRVIGLTDQDLIGSVWSARVDETSYKPIQQWQPEYENEKNQEPNEPTPYDQLNFALQELPKSDQAEVAKILLKKLQSIKNK